MSTSDNKTCFIILVPGGLLRWWVALVGAGWHRGVGQRVDLVPRTRTLAGCRWKNKKSCLPWSSLVEADEQLDRSNSQTWMEWCHACAAYFFRFAINATAYHLGRYSIHLLLLKSSMNLPVKFVNFTAWFSLPIKSLQRLGILKSRVLQALLIVLKILREWSLLYFSVAG